MRREMGLLAGRLGTAVAVPRALSDAAQLVVRDEAARDSMAFHLAPSSTAASLLAGRLCLRLCLSLGVSNIVILVVAGHPIG